jgi:DNA-binding NarL/FixJ family response regulator
LRNGDEVLLGECRLRFRTSAGAAGATMGAEGPPSLTARERDVLVALCRPLRSGDPFAQPASIRQVAKALVVSEAAVKFHLANLYDKFGLHDQTEGRRVQLANEAIRRRAVTFADLKAED